MSLRLQCDICGAKSLAIDGLPPSAREEESLSAFRAEHDLCAVGAVAHERPVQQCGPWGSPRGEPRSTPRPHGHFEQTGPYGELRSGDTLSCCHCRRHWEVVAGSGRTRGFCTRCMGYTCGAPGCDECVPFEQRQENAEAGRSLLAPRPAQALVPAFAGAVILEEEECGNCQTGGPPPDDHRPAQGARECSGIAVEPRASGDAAASGAE